MGFGIGSIKKAILRVIPGGGDDDKKDTPSVEKPSSIAKSARPKTDSAEFKPRVSASSSPSRELTASATVLAKKDDDTLEESQENQENQENSNPKNGDDVEIIILEHRDDFDRSHQKRVASVARQVAGDEADVNERELVIHPVNQMALARIHSDLEAGTIDKDDAMGKLVDLYATVALDDSTKAIDEITDEAEKDDKKKVVNMSLESNRLLVYENIFETLHQNPELSQAIFKDEDPALMQRALGVLLPQVSGQANFSDDKKTADKERDQIKTIMSYIDDRISKPESVFNQSLKRYQEATEKAADNGVFIVPAAGNERNIITHYQELGIDIDDDASYNFLAMSDAVLSVGASDDNGTPDDLTDDKTADFSASGTVSGSPFKTFKPTVLAPGVNIFTTAEPEESDEQVENMLRQEGLNGIGVFPQEVLPQQQFGANFNPFSGPQASPPLVLNEMLEAPGVPGSPAGDVSGLEPVVPIPQMQIPSLFDMDPNIARLPELLDPSKLVTPQVASSGNGLMGAQQGTASLESGTSYAAPQVAAIVHHLLSEDEDLSFSEIKDKLTSRAQSIQGDTRLTGAGVVTADLFKSTPIGDSDDIDETGYTGINISEQDDPELFNAFIQSV